MKTNSISHNLFMPLLLFFFLIYGSLHAQESFEIKGHMEGVSEEMTVILSWPHARQNHSDTILTSDGTFFFSGIIDEPALASLHLVPVTGAYAPVPFDPSQRDIFIGPGDKISIQGKNLRHALIQGGGKSLQEFENLRSRLIPLEEEMAPLSAQMMVYLRENNEPARDSLLPSLVAIRRTMTDVENTFFNEFPDSYVSLHLLSYLLVAIADPVKANEEFFTLSEQIRNSPSGRVLGDRIEQAMLHSIGMPVTEFVMDTPEGEAFNITSLRGQYVLIKFWASWCGPCRMEHPHHKELYEKYQDKNFEILGVSLDERKESWLQAIEQDDVRWIHVSDLKGLGGPVPKHYGIQAIPQSLLIDPRGIIIARNLRGEALDQALRDIFK
jgi:thiol-disulfide isomerase/thioredoxin